KTDSFSACAAHISSPVGTFASSQSSGWLYVVSLVLVQPMKRFYSKHRRGASGGKESIVPLACEAGIRKAREASDSGVIILGCRPLRGLRVYFSMVILRLALQALCCRSLRELHPSSIYRANFDLTFAHTGFEARLREGGRTVYDASVSHVESRAVPGTLDHVSFSCPCAARPTKLHKAPLRPRSKDRAVARLCALAR